MPREGDMMNRSYSNVKYRLKRLMRTLGLMDLLI